MTEYVLLERLASGGMGTVYLAADQRDRELAQLYALKLLHPHLASDDRFAEMFFDEARLASRIAHPNVVPVIDVGAVGDRQFVVMPFIDGGTLLGLCRSELAPVTPAVAVQLVADVLCGLGAAHELCDGRGEALGVVHRDVTLSNVLVGIDGHARVTDFGVARAAQRRSRTEPGVLKGTYAYMSPEQAMGLEVDRRSDLFSVGVILWTLLAGRHPFRGESAAITLDNVLHLPVPRPSTVSYSPRALDRVCLKALDRDPDERYQSAAEMVGALSLCARAAGLRADRDGIGRAVRRVFSDRRRRLRSVVEEVREERRPRGIHSAITTIGERRASEAEAPTAASEARTVATRPRWIVLGMVAAFLAGAGIAASALNWLR